MDFMGCSRCSLKWALVGHARGRLKEAGHEGVRFDLGWSWFEDEELSRVRLTGGGILRLKKLIQRVVWGCILWDRSIQRYVMGERAGFR